MNTQLHLPFFILNNVYNIVYIFFDSRAADIDIHRYITVNVIKWKFTEIFKGFYFKSVFFKDTLS